MFLPQQAFAGASAKSLYRKADKAYLEADYNTTLGYCQKLLKSHKRSALRGEANLLAGLSLLKLARFSEARSYFNTIINQKAKSPLKEDAYLGLADSYYLEKNISKAKELYRETQMLFPDTGAASMVDSRLKEIGKGKTKSLSSKSGYTVQLGSFKARSNASRLYRKFKKKGYSAYILEEKKGGKTYYRVRVGKFKTESKAKAFAKKLTRQGYETKVTAQ